MQTVLLVDITYKVFILCVLIVTVLTVDTMLCEGIIFLIFSQSNFEFHDWFSAIRVVARDANLALPLNCDS